MNLILYFLLTHFLADYPLQPNGLIKMKRRGYWGVFLHCLVHLAVILVILMPFLFSPRVWGAIAIVFATHNIIDQTKVTLDKKYPEHRVFLYFLDQFAHLMVGAGVSFYVGKAVPNSFPALNAIYSHQSFALYLLILVLVTYFYDVTRYFILTLEKKNTHYSRNYRIMMWNVLAVSIAFAVYWMV